MLSHALVYRRFCGSCSHMSWQDRDTALVSVGLTPGWTASMQKQGLLLHWITIRQKRTFVEAEDRDNLTMLCQGMGYKS